MPGDSCPSTKRRQDRELGDNVVAGAISKRSYNMFNVSAEYSAKETPRVLGSRLVRVRLRPFDSVLRKRMHNFQYVPRQWVTGRETMFTERNTVFEERLLQLQLVLREVLGRQYGFKSSGKPCGDTSKAASANRQTILQRRKAKAPNPGPTFEKVWSQDGFESYRM